MKGLELQTSAYNLFDEHYAFPAGDEFVPDVIAQDGRSFRVKFVYRF